MAEETNGTAQEHRATWNHREELAEKMVPLIGTLYRDNNVITSIYGRQLIHKGVIDIIKAHRYARQIDEAVLPVEETYPIVEAMTRMDLGAASIDLGKLAARFRTAGGDLQHFLNTELADVAGQGGEGVREKRDVVLYGFGRIGRLLARIILSHEGGGSSLRLRAIVVRKNCEDDLIKRASLLRRDSIHGAFEGTITVDEEKNTITANGTVIQVIYSNDPGSVDYPSFGIDNAIVVDNTGRWRDEDGLGQHLKSPGVAKVLLTAPGKGEIKNIVYGVNGDDITDEDTILSAASCTTNGITPVLKVINEEYGIDHGHVETVHAYTNDQNLTDNFHKGSRRGRAAGLNMVLTETGAAKAVAKALPELKGKLSGNAIRVPTPDVSMAILNLELEKETTVEELNARLREESLTGNLRHQIDYIHSPEVVSTDFVGSNRAGIVDGLATIVNGGKNAVLYVWYDNEFGYSCQVVRVIEKMTGDTIPALPRS
ncbi:glyceraldehyde-3-phosphate dehydrogenase [Citricoccus sp. GCM10030269]|uniref:glyceraldehyde-3-phosphate dehydrogenase n=1 Tax=Citricoccus sp. GCM10030269 TaxID=3273388 RepID=UPI00360F5B14